MGSDEVSRFTGRRSKGRRVRIVSGEGGAARADTTRQEARVRHRGTGGAVLLSSRGFSAVRDALLVIELARSGRINYLQFRLHAVYEEVLTRCSIYLNWYLLHTELKIIIKKIGCTLAPSWKVIAGGFFFVSFVVLLALSAGAAFFAARPFKYSGKTS